MAASSVRKFTDPDDYSSSFRDFQYELNVTVGGDFAAEHIRVDLHKLRLQHYSSNLPWVAHTAIPDDRAVFALRAEPGPSLLRAGEEILPTNIERLARGQTIFTRSSGSVSWGTISLSRDALAAIGVATSGRELMTPVDVTTETPHPAAIEQLRRLYAVAGRLAKTAPHILAHSEAARSLEHDLVCALAACLGPATNDEDAVAKRRHAVIMRRFRALIAARYDRPVYTTDLCAAIGVSDRTLEICCREHLGMSPQKYLRLRRMQRVRRALTLADPGSATVTGLATANGFWELGRFAMTYRSLYGELPSATLARAGAPGA